MTDYTELKRLAEKASPGPWWIDSHGMTMMSMPDLQVVFNHPQQSVAVRNEETGNLSHWRNDWDASYIAAANPAAILALIAENERDELALRAFSRVAETAVAERDQLNAAISTPESVFINMKSGRIARISLRSAIDLHGEVINGDDAQQIEIAKLRAEVAGLKTGYEAYERVNAELKTDNEALRKDAVKWGIVKRAGDQLLSDEGRAAIWSACSRILISVASELNSGRSVVTEEGVTKGGVEIGDWRVTVERIDAALGQGERS